MKQRTCTGLNVLYQSNTMLSSRYSDSEIQPAQHSAVVQKWLGNRIQGWSSKTVGDKHVLYVQKSCLYIPQVTFHPATGKMPKKPKSRKSSQWKVFLYNQGQYLQDLTRKQQHSAGVAIKHKVWIPSTPVKISTPFSPCIQIAPKYPPNFHFHLGGIHKEVILWFL